MVSGVSSFAFQGTNAHALLAAAPSGGSISRPVSTEWQRSRFWLLPLQFDCIQAVKAGRQVAVFVASLQRPGMAPLLQLSMAGSSLVTVGTNIEFSAAAVAQLSAGSEFKVGTGFMNANSAVDAAQQPVLQLAVGTQTGSLETFVMHSGTSSTLKCCSAQLAGCKYNVKAVAAMPAVSRRPAFLPPARHHLLDAAHAHLEQDAHSLLQTTAIKPAALDAALQLRSQGSLAACVDAAILNSAVGTPQHAVVAVAGGSSALLLLGARGEANLQLQGIDSSPVAAPAVHQKPGSQALEQEAGMLYSVGWEAASVSRSAPAVEGPAVLARCAAGVAEAVSVAQAALAQATPGLSADLPGLLRPVTAPSAARVPSGLAAVQGVLKALAQEAPALSVGVTSSSSSGPPAPSAGWALHFSGSNSSDVHGAASCGALAFLPRLLAQPPATSSSSSLRNTRGSYAVTGGSGVLGGHVAAWLLQQGAPAVHLLSRSGCVPAAVLAQQSFEECPSAAVVVSTKNDAACAADVAELRAAAPGLQGVMHAGGVLADATLPNQTLLGVLQASIRVAPTLRPYAASPYLKFPLYASSRLLRPSRLPWPRFSSKQERFLWKGLCCFHRWQPCWAPLGRPTTAQPMRCSMQQLNMHSRPAPLRPACSGAPGQAPAWPPMSRPLQLGLSA
jgi:hypothetical protein